MAFGDDTEPAKKFDAQGWSNSHLARLYMFERAVDPVFVASHPSPPNPFMKPTRDNPAFQNILVRARADMRLASITVVLNWPAPRPK